MKDLESIEQASEQQLRRAKEVLSRHFTALRNQVKALRILIEPLPDKTPKMWVLNSQLWVYEIWLKTYEASTIHFYDLFLEGISLRRYRNLILDAANEAFRDVAKRESFGNVLNEIMSIPLRAKRKENEQEKDWVEAMDLVSPEHIERVGERMLQYEQRQKSIENKLDQLKERLTR